MSAIRGSHRAVPYHLIDSGADGIDDGVSSKKNLLAQKNLFQEQPGQR